MKIFHISFTACSEAALSQCLSCESFILAKCYTLRHKIDTSLYICGNDKQTKLLLRRILYGRP